MSDEALPELFAEALALDQAGRRTLLSDLALRDPALAAELARLLAGAETPSPLLDRTPWPLAGDAGAFAAEASDTAPPERIGPYRILRELGRGGMGRVYLAAEETPDFRRTIALKVIDRPAPDALRRFRDEVRILSSLEHPGIARFISGGRAADGTWYLALEYIEGEDLVAYARRMELPVARRVELFLAVLEAVEFAHAQGVVHRDLKPGHLLVGRDGRPRLLDFGISKLLDPETHETLAVTRTEARALTPAYASPEQFRGEPITPASDIYSLGVVLYELLAGHRPFASGGDSRAALERAVLETDPEPPSQAARRTGGGSGGTGRSAREPRRPERGLGRDLDAICLKALRKEPQDRYASVAYFAADLRRFLDRLPVEARGGSWRYRALRFAGRHRTPIATWGATAVALLALALAWHSRHSSPAAGTAQATTAREAAFPPATGTETVAELERRFAAAPASLEAGADLAAALQRDERFKEAAVVMARARQLPGAADDPLLDKVEGMIANSLDEPQRALALFRRALANAAGRGRADLVPSLQVAVARTLSDLGQTAEARAALVAGRAEAERIGDQSTLAVALNDLAVDELQQGNLAAGELLLEQALVPARTLADRSRLGLVLNNLAGIAIERGRPDLAETRYREAIAVWEKAGRRQRAAMAAGNLAMAIADLGRSADAAAARETAIATLRGFEDRSALSVLLTSRGNAAIDAGDLGAAGRDADEIDAAALAAGSRESLAYSEELRGRIAWLRGDLAAARRHLEQAESLHAADGDMDLAAEVAVQRATEEFRAGAAATAEKLLAAALARLEGGGQGTTALVAAALRARLAASAGREVEARQQLGRLGAENASSPSLTRRLAYLAVRGTLAGIRGESAAMQTDFRQAATLAEQGGRVVEALSLRLDLAALEQRAGTGATDALEVERAAAALGLPYLVGRAKRIATLR